MWACKNYDGDVQSDSVAQGGFEWYFVALCGTMWCCVALCGVEWF